MYQLNGSLGSSLFHSVTINMVVSCTSASSSSSSLLLSWMLCVVVEARAVVEARMKSDGVGFCAAPDTATGTQAGACACLVYS